MIVAFALMVIGLQAAFDSQQSQSTETQHVHTAQLDWAFGSPALRVPMGSRLRCVPLSQVLARDQSTHPSIPSVFWFCHPRPGCGRRLHGPPREDDLVKLAGYVAKDTEAQIVNTTGLFLVLFAMGVTFLLSKFSTDH